MKEDKKLLYFISPNKDNNFYEQLERVDDLFQRERHHVFNSDFKVFKAKEIYDFVRRLDPITGNKTISKCLILDNSNQFDSKVLICPIYPKSASENKFGLNIGKIYQINDSEEYGKPTIWIDGINETVGRVIGGNLTEVLFTKEDGTQQLHYYLHPVNAKPAK